MAAHRILVSALVLGVLAGAAVTVAPAAVVAAPAHQQHAAKPVEHAAKPTEAVAPAIEGATAVHEETVAHAGEEAAHEGEAHKAGLPQLNPVYFPGQTFWLLVNFAILYLLMANVALPGVKATQDARRRTIKRDLSEAKAASEAAQAAQALSDKVMGEARSKAMAAVAAIKSAAAEESAERQNSLQRDLAKRIRSAEAKISTARVAALQEVQDKAAGILASEIVKKVSGLSVDPSHLTLPAADSGSGRA